MIHRKLFEVILFLGIWACLLGAGGLSPKSQSSDGEHRAYLPLVASNSTANTTLVVDHNHTDITRIPTTWLEVARQKVAFIYGHTSHGSQLVTGAGYLRDQVDPILYKFLSQWYTIPVQVTPPALRAGDDGSWGWDPGAFLGRARDQLNASHAGEPGQIRVFMWSWCGQMSDPGMPDDTPQQYLNLMAQLESEYPGVIFVYMTGHTDDSNPALLNQRNNVIRNYVYAQRKVLYDFADIESYRPDGTVVVNPDDSCPWCPTWCTAHPQDCLNLPANDGECAHSHGFNCKLKGQAWWWLAAKLAGW